MNKLVKNSEEIRDKLKNGVRLITEPVIQTLSPLGKNVIYEDKFGGKHLTNDGVTIAKEVSSDDPIENTVIDIIKLGSLRTNKGVGDGTTTTTLLTSKWLEEGWKKIEEGVNPMILKKEFEKIANTLASKLKPIEVKTDDDILHIAKISASGDDDIAKNTLDIIKTAGLDGIIAIEDYHKDETVVEKNEGFIINDGIFSPEYAQIGGYVTKFDECHVLVTDKRLYYAEEAETILRTAIAGGITNLVIVARDFIGKAVNTFSTNQINNEAINLLLVKDSKSTEKDNTSLSDLALYLGGTLVTEKNGKLVDNLTIDDFCVAKNVYADPQRVVITKLKESSPELEVLIKTLKEKKIETDDDEDVQKRLASLTTGMVTVKVGGATPIEVRERLFRYEDSINAVRSAMRDGYLAGGGLSLLGAYNPEDYTSEYVSVAKKISESSIRQIAKNCGKHEEYIISNCKPDKHIGYNVYTDSFEDLLKDGVIDPFNVTELAIKNSVSIANSILTAGWFIVNEIEKDDK